MTPEQRRAQRERSAAGGRARRHLTPVWCLYATHTPFGQPRYANPVEIVFLGGYGAQDADLRAIAYAEDYFNRGTTLTVQVVLKTRRRGRLTHILVNEIRGDEHKATRDG